MTQVVVDTNISVSALLWGGAPQHLFTTAMAKDIPLLTSKALLEELEATLNKPRLAKYVTLTNKTPSELVDEIATMMTLVEAGDVPLDSVRDIDDVEVLAVAVGGKATHIVSGDKDLLVLGSYQNIVIMKVVDFLKELEAE